jgi:hypothetical protein
MEIKDEFGKIIFNVGDDVPDEIACEVVRNLKSRGMLPDAAEFSEEFLDEVERQVCE